MPLLSPHQINKVLSEAGVAPKASSDLEVLLQRNGLTPDDVLSEIGNIMRGAEHPSSKLKAAEIGAKLNGLLKGDEIANVPVVNIIINDSEFIMNPILVPRELSQ
jgi:hypothetical protein